MDNNQGRIVFFDGVCGLCNRFVNFIVRRDKRRLYRFATLQGAFASAGLDSELRVDPDTIVYRENDQLYFRSEAVLRIVAGLGGAWKIVNALRIFPRGLRDVVYNFIARHRYRLFGKREKCRIPSPEERSYFLD